MSASDGISMDITYQDGLRLSELYGRLESLNFDLDNLLVSSLDDVILVLFAFTFMYIVTSLLALNLAKIMFFTESINNGWRRKEVWTDHGEMGFTISAVAIVVLYFILATCIVDLILDYAEFGINREIVDVEAQIESILSRYGEVV